MGFIEDLVSDAPNDEVIKKSIITTYQKMQEHEHILCSISGGSDSDIILDLCQRIPGAEKIQYAFFDTGLEFKATKEHLLYLEEKYGISIDRVKAIKPIPVCCREFGQPFLSKQVSEWIGRLQSHGFAWEDLPFDELYDKYPNCKAALRWWCNDFPNTSRGISSYNIEYNAYLKEFLIDNPPNFLISNKCCHYAKKKVASDYKRKTCFDLNMYGVRKAEGGARRGAYKNCFTPRKAGADEYRPIFWYKAEEKKEYEEYYGVEHSKCYSEYGLKRTGCAGCPYARNFEEELLAMQEFEPNLYKAVNNVFSDSYEYTRKYHKYVEQKKKEKKKQKEE